MGLVEHEVQRDPFTVVAEFRSELYACLTARSDALFELCDALLCTDGPVRTFVELALAPEHRRGHGTLYSGINRGRIDVARLRRALTGVPLPRAGDGRLVLAVDVSPWLRPDADTSSDRSFCHTFGRGLGKHQMVPGWPYSIVAALETGRTSWTALLDAIRLEPGEGDPEVLVVLDAGYDAPRIAHLLADLPVEVLGRLRSDRVMRKPVPVPWICPPQGGRPPKHGGEFVFGRPESWGEVTAATVTDTDRYGTVTAQAWGRLHPRLTRRAAWLDHEGPLPIIEGLHRDPAGSREAAQRWGEQACLAVVVGHRRRPRGRRPVPAGVPPPLRRGTHVSAAQAGSWVDPAQVAGSAAADRWTWLVLAAHAQLRLARPLARDLRRPWERPAERNRLTPARVRRGFRNLHAKTGTPAGAPKPTLPGPGRPVGSKNRQPATRYGVGRVLATGEPYARPLTTRKAPNRAEVAAPPPPFIATIPTMLDSGMVRRKKVKKKRPTWGIPKGIVLLATPEGWRFMIQPLEGGMLCGRLDIPINTDPQDARDAAAVMVAELARDVHDTDVEVTWDPPTEPWSWTAQVTLATSIEPAPSGTEGWAEGLRAVP